MIKQEVYINGVPTLVLQSKLTRDETTGDYYKHYKEDMTPDLVLIKSLSIKESLTTQINEAKNYLNETSWIWEKFNRNVLLLKDLSNEEFNTKYQDIILQQEESRVLIKNLRLELEQLLIQK